MCWKWKTPLKVVENGRTNILSNFQIQTDDDGDGKSTRHYDGQQTAEEGSSDRLNQNTWGNGPQTVRVAPTDPRNKIRDLCPKERSSRNSQDTAACGRGPELERGAHSVTVQYVKHTWLSEGARVVSHYAFFLEAAAF